MKTTSNPANVIPGAHYNRRSFFGAAAMTFAAAQLGVFRSAAAQSSEAKPAEIPPSKSVGGASFAALKQIDAGVLRVGYAEAGPADGQVVMLLHGWPYDIYSFVDVAPLVASAGFRVVVPYLRGYGMTRFHSNHTMRKRPAGGIGRRRHRPDGCTQGSKGNRGRV